MFCEKCEGIKFKELSRVFIGYKSKKLDSIKSWTTYECLDCKLQKTVKELLSDANNLWKKKHNKK